MSIFLKDPLHCYSSQIEFDVGRIGEISTDRTAVVGRNGWCFIYDGTNNYKEAYHDKSLIPLGDRWASLIELRESICKSLGIHFVQLIVPNKATVMPDNFPEPLGDGVSTVLHSFLSAKPDANFLCPIDLMRDPVICNSIFRRNDSHLTVSGNVILAELILKSLGLTLPKISHIEVSKVDHIGDLGCKFVEQISEVYFAPRFDSGLLNQSLVIKNSESVVAGFNGTHQAFSNPNAPFSESVLILGNSFFEKNPSWGMCPLFVSLFQEVNFVWTPMFDKDLVGRLKPDFVIAQTCERFLNKLPDC